jgi:glycosyltransferase involved in cell wall biosynthesis
VPLIRPVAPLRVLFLATYFPKPGNELLGPWALKQAQALRRQGADVRVVSFSSWVPKLAAVTRGARAYANCPREADWDGLHVSYPRWPIYHAGPLRRWVHRNPQLWMGLGWRVARPVLDRVVAEFKPDVVYAHHTAVNGCLAERLHRRHGLPFVVTDHDFGEIEDCRRYSRRRAVFARVAGSAFRMIAVASRMERALKDQFPGARTMTLANGTDPLAPALWETPRPPETRGKLVVFCLSAFYTRKGIPLLVRAFAPVAAKHPDAVLRIAGDGAERPLVEAAIRQTGLGDRVQLLGFIPHAQAMQEMVWADVFALTGWDEPFATVFLEAASAAKPMVWCNDGGINDVLRDQEHGFAVPPKDEGAVAAALDRLLANPSLREQLGASARQLFESKLTWDANARVMSELFRATGRSA